MTTESNENANTENENAAAAAQQSAATAGTPQEGASAGAEAPKPDDALSANALAPSSATTQAAEENAAALNGTTLANGTTGGTESKNTAELSPHVEALQEHHDALYELLRKIDGEAEAAGTFINSELDKAYYLIKDGFEKAIAFLKGGDDDTAEKNAAA